MNLRSTAILALAAVAGAQKVVKVDINKQLPKFLKAPLVRRDAFSQELVNNITSGGYTAQVEIGTPGQKILMTLDTGSSDAWIVSSNATLCSSTRLQAKYQDTCGATFDSSKSSSFEVVAEDGFTISYVDGSEASGDYVSDNFKIGGKTVKGLQMGLGTDIAIGMGVLGIGFANNTNAETEYDNIVAEMVEQDLIPYMAYSLYLNDRRSSTGSILFGGIDTDKFIGELDTLPIIPDLGGFNTSQLAITLGSVSVNAGSDDDDDDDDDDSLTLDAGFPAILDSGSTLSYLPDRLADKINAAVGAQYDTLVTGLTLVSCTWLTNGSTLDINFAFGNSSPPSSSSGKTIRVPVSELVLDLLKDYVDLLPPLLPFKPEDTCVFGIQSTAGFGSMDRDLADAVALLGDTVLRSAYVVYDLAHGRISVAQANLNSFASNIVEFRAGESAIPASTGVARQQTTATPTPTASSGGGGRGGSSGGGSGGQTTVTRTAEATPSNAAGPGASAATGGLLFVGAWSCMLALFSGALFFV